MFSFLLKINSCKLLINCLYTETFYSKVLIHADGGYNRDLKLKQFLL